MRFPSFRKASFLFVLAVGSLACAPSLHAAGTVTLQQFDSACGQPGHNCRDAFQKAFAAEARTGGVIQLPAGTFPVDFPEVPQNVRSAPALQRSSLLAVPPGVTIQGHLDAGGNPDSVIEWKATDIPIFVFAGASHAGMKNLHFRFTGTNPQFYPYGDIAVLQALGYHPVFPHTDQMSGGNFEDSSLIYVFDSEYCSFDNIVVDSATHDNDHVYGFAFNVKGKGVAVTPEQSGLTAAALGNSFTRLHLYDGVMPMLISGQQNLVLDNISGDRRGSSKGIAPGHLIYINANNLFGPKSVIRQIENKNITVTNITEGPNTYSNVNALATFALKNIDGGTFRHIVSQHPEGLVQVLFSTRNVTFQDMTWSSNRDLCSEPDSPNCEVPVFSSVASQPPALPNSNLVFTNLSFTSTKEPIQVAFHGENIQVNGLTIQTPPDFHRDQKNASAVLDLTDCSRTSITNYTYIPVVSSADASRQYNTPYTCWGKCSDVHASVTIRWPKNVPVPAKGAHAITPGVQFAHPGDNNTIDAHIVPR